MKKTLTLVFFYVATLSGIAEEEKETNLIADGNELHQEEAYAQAEGEYRKALSINSIIPKAQHNLGNALYRSKDFDQANQRFFETQKNSLNKADKHLAFHNMGNGFMQQKAYEKAVEAYKNALRNNPTDEETRYNFALAKELLEKQKEEEEQQDQNQDQDQDQQDDQEKKEDDSEGDKKEKPSDEGEDGDEKEDKKDQEEKDDKGKDDKEKDDPKKPKENKKEVQHNANSTKKDTRRYQVSHERS